MIVREMCIQVDLDGERIPLSEPGKQCDCLSSPQPCADPQL